MRCTIGKTSIRPGWAILKYSRTKIATITPFLYNFLFLQKVRDGTNLHSRRILGRLALLLRSYVQQPPRNKTGFVLRMNKTVLLSSSHSQPAALTTWLLQQGVVLPVQTRIWAVPLQDLWILRRAFTAVVAPVLTCP